jgi:urease accessory protein
MAVGIVLAALPGAALAHTGLAANGFVSGFVHPFGGLDHVLAMFAVGLWAARLGGRATWAVPTAFVVVMAAGAAAAMAGLALPPVEVGVAGSLLVLGAVIALDRHLPLASALPLVAVLAVFHGFAHGAEATGAAYGLGFALATAALHGLGLACGFLANRLVAARPVQAGGGALALAGLWMLTAL